MKEKLIRITTVPLSLEKLLENQLAYMQQHFDVTAVSAEKERLERFATAQGVRSFYVNLTREITPIADLIAVYKLYNFLKRERPRIVHSHTPKAGIVGMMAAYFARVPIRLHTVAGLPLMEATGFKRFVLNVVEKLTYAFATGVYPNSKGLQDFILAEGFTSEKKLSIIGAGSSNGIDTTYFSPKHFSREELVAKKETLGITADDFVFIFVGRLVTDKGINELVAAFEESEELNSSSSLLLVGPFEDELDPLSERTKNSIEKNSRIITTGYQEDVRIYFALSNALVFPSYREGFPNVVMQAGAMGLPAIVSNINGCNEIVTDKQNGLIVPKKDKPKLKGAMEHIWADKSAYEAMAADSRKEIVAKYERSVLWEALLAEYKGLIEKKCI